MTGLGKKATLYADEHCEDQDEDGFWLSDMEMLRRAYIAGAEENGIIWHDLRKNPDNLPERGQQVITVRNDARLLAYLREDNVWTIDGHNAFESVIAWCEIPRFEVGL